MKIIGISGRRESGKDTLGNKLRDVILELKPKSKVEVRSTADWVKTLIHRFCRVPRVYLWGADSDKAMPLPCNRSMDGREAARRLYATITSIDPGCCIRYAIDEPRVLGYDYLILPCVRNRIDIEGIQEAGGKVIRLTRTVHPEDTYPEEVELDGYEGFDHVIENERLEPIDTLMSAVRFMRREDMI